MSQQPVNGRVLFCLAAFALIIVVGVAPARAVEGDMEGGRWELVGANGAHAGAFRNGMAEGFPRVSDPRRNGRFTMWHADGAKSGEANFRNGTPDGEFRGWHENGQLAVEGRVANCEVVTTFWDPLGRRRFSASETSPPAY